MWLMIQKKAIFHMLELTGSHITYLLRRNAGQYIKWNGGNISNQDQLVVSTSSCSLHVLYASQENLYKAMEFIYKAIASNTICIKLDHSNVEYESVIVNHFAANNSSGDLGDQVILANLGDNVVNVRVVNTPLEVIAD